MSRRVTPTVGEIMRSLSFSTGGTRFGSCSDASPRNPSMTTTPPTRPEQRTYAPRQRDRRHGLAEWLSALARSLDRRTDVAALRDSFENGLRTVVRARSVQLREPGHRWPTRAAPATGSESIALDVPGADHTSSGLLDVTFDPECHLGDWDFQTLTIAAHVGSLVLEIERGRTQAYRSGAIGGSRQRRDW